MSLIVLVMSVRIFVSIVYDHSAQSGVAVWALQAFRARGAFVLGELAIVVAGF